MQKESSIANLCRDTDLQTLVRMEILMKNLYRIGIFVVVCLITGLLAVYLFDQFVLNVKDIGGRLPQVYENQEELEANQNTRAYALPSAEPSAGQDFYADRPEELQRTEDENAQSLSIADDMPDDIEGNADASGGTASGALEGSGTEGAQAVHTESVGSVITKTTVYAIEEYQRQTHEIHIVTERVPAQYVGMDRKALEEALALYLESPSLRDLERGLTDIRLVSFSPERVMVRKSYEMQPEYDYYYLTEEQGFVVVYYRNLGTLFCETGIELENLPDRLQREIRQIKTIETEEELYGFLESYSS